jgi:serine/threonine protein kinase
MALSAGTRLGAYDIVALIGAGGMGEVYRATDTNLKRAVAIKILPESVGADRERIARFQREAEVLASLNHLNIATIYGLERSHGTTALVMELVEGPTLAARIAQGPIPIDQALPVAKQIAEAFEAAHDAGVIYQDQTGRHGQSARLRPCQGARARSIEYGG